MRRILAGLGTAAFLAAGYVHAQMPGVFTSAQQAPSGPTGFPVGPLTVTPGVVFAQGYDDNLFWQPNNTRSSSFSVLSPFVRLEANPGPHKFSATARIDGGTFWNSRNDDFTDYSLLANGDIVFSGRAGLAMRLGYLHGHDPRGSTDRAAQVHPDEWDNYGADGVFRYGAPGAQGRIEVDAGWYARRYTNNRLTTSLSDRDTSRVGGTFYWRVMPRTEILAQAGRTWIDYQDPASTQSSTEDRLLLGVKWEATAATTGYAKIGRMRKDFDSSLRPTTTNPSWDLGVRWSPLTYSVFNFTTSSSYYESTGVGDAIRTQFYGATWDHAWNSRFRTQALANYSNSDFVDSFPQRTDKTGSLGLKAFYDFRRWLRFGAEYTYWNRDSNIDINDYKRNLFLLTVGASL